MKKTTVVLVLLNTLNVQAESISEALKSSESEINGYLRATYHVHDIDNGKLYEDDAIGGKLHYATPSYQGFKLGSSLYFTTKVFNDDNSDLIPLRGEYDKSYAIIGELYIQGEFGNSVLKIGRQELNTPFADIDDIGMVPNTFGGISLVNNDLENTEIFLAQINKMAGVGAEVVDKFTRINGSQNMEIVGVDYRGFENITLSAWYNRLKNAEVDGIGYLESTYENDFQNYTYGLGLQYANQSYSVGEDAKVFGAKVDLGVNNLGLLFSGAYNEIKDNVASSGFGGGPFFSGAEFLVVDNAGKNAKTTSLGLEYDASTLGLNNLTLGVGKMYIETESKAKSSELDVLAAYQINEKLVVDMVYTHLKAEDVGVDDAKHLHVYVNYSF